MVSVLMTAYNRQEYIAEAIDSVLASDFADFELIIVDDRSTDNTVTIAKAYEQKDSRIKVFVNDHNLGDYPNRNQAASYALGKYIKYVDSDDKILPHGLGLMVAAMEQFPKAAFGFSDTKNTSSKYPFQYSGEEALRKHFLRGGLLQAGPSTSIIRTAAFKKMGGFSGQRFISDYQAWLRFCLDYAVVIFSTGLMWVRSHKGQEMDIGKLPYYSLNYNLHKEFILKTPNPFTAEEKKRILYNYRILLGRRVYQRLLPWFGIKQTLHTIRDCGENGLLFLHALKPMKKHF